jgi:hypothetical protein
MPAGRSFNNRGMVVENFFNRLPVYWQKWIENYTKEASNGKWDRLRAGDFSGSVKIRFPDGSFVLFENAFYAIDESRDELAVFTEHCGYHVFSLSEDLEYSYNVWAVSPGNSYQDEEEE